ncbi:hypothetical protein EON63_23750, partial [archaeon]
MRFYSLYLLLLFCVLYGEVRGKVVESTGDSKNSPFWMDIEWVLQASSFSFDGFFTEVLGLAESLHHSFPLLRLVKSSFSKALDEPPIAAKSTLLTDLFVEERDALNELISTTVNHNDLSIMYPPVSVFSRQHKDVILECIEYSTDSPLVQTILESPQLSKYAVTNAQSMSECCQYCQQSPFCSYYIYNMTSQGCMLKSAHTPISHTPTPTPTTIHIQLGSIQPRSTLPRAIIFHGTTCVYQNTTLPRRRDIHTIYIGRY